MDIEEIHKKINEDRRKRFEGSDQLSLGQFISRLEKIPNEKKGTEDEKTVCFDFEYAFPTRLDSWRGIYSELALGFDLGGYNQKADKEASAPALSAFIDHLKSAIGKTFEGWKGGDFTMDENTPVWVSNPGNNGHTVIVNVIDNDWEVILETRYSES